MPVSQYNNCLLLHTPFTTAATLIHENYAKFSASSAASGR